ncbi:MAG: hypothetical protein EKK64_09885 [Neisseriaceae bacterium]|nr:MAG: hypothetical protein EKK64_09885 [Neisseriaceae bacterium]
MSDPLKHVLKLFLICIVSFCGQLYIGIDYFISYSFLYLSTISLPERLAKLFENKSKLAFISPHVCRNAEKTVWMGSLNLRKKIPTLSLPYTTFFRKFFTHRRNDLPAVIYSNGDKEWWYLGMKHREKKPAVIRANGDQEWWHRDELIYIKYANGTKEWYLEGQLHREDAPAIEYANGDQEWWRFGKRHRVRGPAIIIGNKKYWYVNGEFLND